MLVCDWKYAIYAASGHLSESKVICSDMDSETDCLREGVPASIWLASSPDPPPEPLPPPDPLPFPVSAAAFSPSAAEAFELSLAASVSLPVSLPVSRQELLQQHP